MSKKYYVSGYSTPKGVNNSDDVKAWQKKLGVTADGVWGKQTQAAYDNYNKSKSQNKSTSSLTGDGFDWEGTGKELEKHISKSLRPSVDMAISEREKLTSRNKADIDADAAARGMESSTFVTSMKTRENSYEADDIAYLEASYEENLAKQLYDGLMTLHKDYLTNKHNEEQLALEKDKLALERDRMSQQQAQFDAEMNLKNKQLKFDMDRFDAELAYKTALAEKTGDNSDYVNGVIKLGYDYADYYELMVAMTVEERYNFFKSDDVWNEWRRQTIIADIGLEGYYLLYDQYCDDRVREYQDELGKYKDDLDVFMKDNGEDGSYFQEK